MIQRSQRQNNDHDEVLRSFYFISDRGNGLLIFSRSDHSETELYRGLGVDGFN